MRRLSPPKPRSVYGVRVCVLECGLDVTGPRVLSAAGAAACRFLLSAFCRSLKALVRRFGGKDGALAERRGCQLQHGAHADAGALEHEGMYCMDGWFWYGMVWHAPARVACMYM